MAELKTQENNASVEAFLAGVENTRRREDALEVVEIMREISGLEPKMWGKAIIGFGSYDYTYASGRSGTWMRLGLSPRKQKLVVYIMDDYSGREELMARLGKHKTGKSCLYLNKLDDIDRDVLRELIRTSLDHMAERYPE